MNKNIRMIGSNGSLLFFRGLFLVSIENNKQDQFVNSF
jgi:hypothetical protein